jgi:transposase-like protein
MARRKGTTRKYTKAQRQEIVRRIASGETQAAVAASTGVPLATVGYWARKAKGAGGANSASRATAKGGRPARAQRQARTRGGATAGIAWALDGDVLVIRIPLRAFARQIAEEALAKI